SFHSVVSGQVTGGVGTADGQFCNSNNTNCATAPLLSANASYMHTFPTAGTFPYFCAPHARSGMVGTITVQPCRSPPLHLGRRGGWRGTMSRALVALVVGLVVAGSPAMAADAPATDAKFSQAQLEEMIAPIALYPDEVLSTMCIAATYPLEI